MKSIQKKVRYRQGEQRRPNIHIIRDPEDKTKQTKQQNLKINTKNYNSGKLLNFF